jgi:hypothetical protein
LAEFPQETWRFIDETEFLGEPPLGNDNQRDDVIQSKLKSPEYVFALAIYLGTAGLRPW